MDAAPVAQRRERLLLFHTLTFAHGAYRSAGGFGMFFCVNKGRTMNKVNRSSSARFGKELRSRASLGGAVSLIALALAGPAWAQQADQASVADAATEADIVVTGIRG